MEYNPSYQINVQKRDVIVRFRRELIDQSALSRFLDFLELESIRQRSALTEEQAADLAKEIDQSVWENIKEAFLEG
ncbi:MAG: hypothetical protein Q7U34_02020 [Anaerolineales bacterium]|nr:hypothetical protein [Anaerolineales bacterium]MDP3185088.1 hypothetical protein [Anaerolineales bacterium]